MKKLSVVAVAVCMFVGSSFAAWDYFPPKEAGKGQARLNFEYKTPNDKNASEAVLALKGRYSIIEGLEAALSLPIPLWAKADGADDAIEGYAGLKVPAIGVRYWLMDLGLGFYLDLGLPVDTRYDKDDLAKVGYEPAMGLDVGVQYSKAFGDALSLGSQLGLNVPFAGGDSKAADGMGLVVGAEVDYAIGSLTAFLGAEMGLGLTPGTVDGKTKQVDGKDADPDPFAVDIWIGAAYSINDMFGVDLSATFGVSDKYKTVDLSDPLKPEEKTFIPIKIAFDFDFNF